jgi:hypothetical protein
MPSERKHTSGPSGQHLGVQVGFRAESPEQVERWRRAAEADGRTLNGWLRWLADAAAAKHEKRQQGQR